MIPEKVSEPVSVKFGIGKKSRNRYRKNLVPKKVPVSVSEIFGTGKKYRYRYRLKFWVPSHTDVISMMMVVMVMVMVLCFPASRSYFNAADDDDGDQ